MILYVPSYLSTKFVKDPETHSHCARQNNQLNFPQCRNSAAQCVFPFRASKYWNSLPNDIRNSASIVGFHMTSLKFKPQTIDPTEILLSWCIRAVEN